MQRSRNRRTPRYLVFALQGLGDALEATPLIAELRRSDPTATIDVAVSRAGPARFFEELPNLVSHVLELPYWERGVATFAAKLIRKSRQNRYDTSFMTYPSAKAPYHIVNGMFWSCKKIGHRYARPTLKNMLWTYTDLVPVRPVHNVERNLDLLSPTLIARPPYSGYVVPQTWLAPETSPVQVAIHVGTIAHDGFENKRWPLINFGAVARHCIATGYEVSLICGPDEVPETQKVYHYAPGSKVFRGKLDETARYLSRSALVIANDSGIAHLAAAVGAPVLSLFGPTPITGAPYGPLSSVLRPSLCPPCFDPLAKGICCVRDIDFQCIRQDLTVEMVIERIDRLLGRGRLERSP